MPHRFNEEYTRIVNLITAILYFKQIKKNQSFQTNEYFPKRTYILPNRKSNEDLLIDSRYEAFFAAILDENCIVPPNFNFISWNYDFQIEKTLHYYNDGYRITEIANQNMINYNNFKLTNKSSQVIKLNGTSFFMSNSEIIDSTNYDMYTQGILIDALSDDTNNLKKVSSLIKFAWENETEIKNHHAIANEKIKESDFVVVVGYSFPIFNRQVDIDLFKGFDVEKTEIIIQAPESDVHQYIEQLESIQSGLSKVARPFTNLEQFYIPHEYWTEPKTKGNRARTF
ncbi:MAG: hypothetical protein V4620_13540 [Bacteroidota bacterium]